MNENYLAIFTPKVTPGSTPPLNHAGKTQLYYGLQLRLWVEHNIFLDPKKLEENY